MVAGGDHGGAARGELGAEPREGRRKSHGPATLAALLLLGALLLQWVGAQAGAQITQLGERLWPGYATELRRPPAPPQPPALTDTPAADPAADTAKQPIANAHADANADDDDDLLDDLLADVPEARSSDDLEAARRTAAAATYAREEAAYEAAIARRTPVVAAFAAVDRGLFALFTAISDRFRAIFIILLGIGGVVATATRRHISLRPIRGPGEDRLARGLSLGANLLLLSAVIAQHRGRLAAGTGLRGAEELEAGLWIAAFGAMAAINLLFLVRPARGPVGAAKPASAGGLRGLPRALLGAPLYAIMAALAGAYFGLVEGYAAGLAVYLDKLLANVQLYLQVGLYIWVGMLLGRTRLAEHLFAGLRPWGLPPELLAVLVVTAAAIPTAYSGASGIFVIAAGALIFRELEAAGARRSLALASTAMSGSMGVVLSPCLLVVIIAYLSQVRSDELFAWGRWVFLLSAVLFAVIVLLTRDGELRPRPQEGAARASAAALRGLGIYAAIAGVVLLGAALLLGVSVDVTSAAFLLPLVLLPMLAYDRRRGRTRSPPRPGDEPIAGSGIAEDAAPIVEATAEATIHIGALLLLMALSACLGGVIERAELVHLVPGDFGSPLAAMAGLTVALVLIGMVMDPYGAVILVQATLAGVASANGIDPVHFWMVVLVAFELGYLTPPVALNHLLARQVIGGDAGPAPPATGSWWRRHERYLLPIAVMALTLIIVAFGPLIVAG